MKKKIRKNLQEKIDRALAIAATKEDREVTDEIISNDVRLDIILEGYDHKLLADGRYVYKEWNDEQKCWITHIVENAPVEVLKVLFELARDEKLQERYKRENESPEYQQYQVRVRRGEADILNPMDKPESQNESYLNCFGNPEDIVIRKLCGTEKKPLPAVDLDNPQKMPEIGIAHGGTRFDEDTMLLMKAILNEHLRGVPIEQLQQMEELFGSRISQKELAQFEGVTEAAISKRKAKLMKSASDLFLSLGFPVIDKAELKSESTRRKKYEDHYDAVSREMAKIYYADEDEAEETA